MMYACGQFFRIIVKGSMEFGKYALHEKGTKVIYLQVLRSIYGCIKSFFL